MFKYVNLTPNSGGNIRKHGCLWYFHAASARENISGVWVIAFTAAALGSSRIWHYRLPVDNSKICWMIRWDYLYFHSIDGTCTLISTNNTGSVISVTMRSKSVGLPVACLRDAILSQGRHNERDGVSNHQPRDCLLKCLFRRRSKKTSKLRVTGLCEGNSPVTAQRASNTENVSIWWRHHFGLLPNYWSTVSVCIGTSIRHKWFPLAKYHQHRALKLSFI